MLACPICLTALTLAQKSYVCQQGHRYDIAKDGYVNLHVVQHKHSHHAGDTALSVQARKRFLAQGFYAPFSTKICEIIAQLAPNRVLDIGCGEGYYTQSIADHTDHVIALDIAKVAIQTAAKAHKSYPNIRWVVGTSAALPVVSGSIDVCVSLFAPLPKYEMLRVLTPSGHLVVATPAPHHLYALRAALFDTVRLHTPEKFITELAPEFVLVSSHQVHSPLQLDRLSLGDLIDMTPYTYKAKLANKAQLKAQGSFAVQAAFCIYVFERA